MADEDSGETLHSIEFISTMNSHAAEALRLEIRRLAQSRGIEIRGLRIDKIAGAAESKETNPGN